MFILIPLPRKVTQTSYCTHLLFADVLQTGLGMGMGMNGTADNAYLLLSCIHTSIPQGSFEPAGAANRTDAYHHRATCLKLPTPLPGLCLQHAACSCQAKQTPVLIGWHDLSNATCIIQPHLFYALFRVSRIDMICNITRHF